MSVERSFQPGWLRRETWRFEAITLLTLTAGTVFYCLVTLLAAVWSWWFAHVSGGDANGRGLCSTVWLLYWLFGVGGSRAARVVTLTAGDCRSTVCVAQNDAADFSLFLWVRLDSYLQ